MTTRTTPTGRSRVLQIHPALRCNLRCLHCYSSSGPDASAALAPALVHAAVADAAAEGYDVLGVSGGEPLLWDPLPDVLAAARARGLRTTLTTNGTLLRSARLRAAAPHLDLLAISLDGTPRSHDRMRADPSAFARLAAGLPALRELELPFGFLFTLTQRNVHELRWVADFAAGQGARLLQIHPLEEAGRAARTLAGARPDALEGGVAFLLAHDLQRAYGDRMAVQVDLVAAAILRTEPERFVTGEGERPLAALLSPLVLEADGTLVPFQYGFPRRHALGNLHETPLRTLADRFRASGAPALRALCEDVRVRLASQPDLPLANWYETLREAG